MRHKGIRDINKLAFAILSNMLSSTPRLALVVMYNLPTSHWLQLCDI